MLREVIWNNVIDNMMKRGTAALVAIEAANAVLAEFDKKFPDAEATIKGLQ